MAEDMTPDAMRAHYQRGEEAGRLATAHRKP
jgi:hypothetical protein